MEYKNNTKVGVGTIIIKGIGKYDEDTIIDIYKYAVEYNRIHGEDDYYIDKLKDLDFFKQYPFIFS